MILRSFESAIILDKPAGMSTHTPDSGATLGFTEVCEKLLGEKLWAVHRLDNTTSGCLLCTTNAEGVEPWSNKLKESVKKYVLISENEFKQNLWSYEGRIEKTGNHKFGLVKGENNSHTTFAKIGKNSLGFIYEAEIHSGKTHQIRIHAEASGIPILGDPLHGGAAYPRLMLHSYELQIDKTKINSPLPQAFLMDQELEKKFLNLHKADRTLAMQFLISLDRRRFLFFEKTNSYRLMHREWFEKNKLCIEKLGDVLQIMNYSQTNESLSESLIDFFMNVSNTKYWFIRQMQERGNIKNLNEETKINIQASTNMPLQWQIKENDINFDMRHAQGMSAGLFLDQRDHRLEILQSTHGKKVANFFSYTCGFSLCAALGGAAEVVSVDTSQSSLEWGKNNFKLNDLDPDKYEFFTADSLFFLQACVRRKRKFDLIIIDPPTFSRGKHGTFKLSEQIEELLKNAFLCLEQEGRLLLTFNDEGLESSDVALKIEKAALDAGLSYIRIEKTHPPLDFEFPLERNTVMKGFWVYV
ncbi:MAG: class I SAM-dependent methyltransferase [Oligoflexia bacterium]|nr:class I SAM-dependent methyltransferase [Oligoflexia bacterium]